MTRSDRVRAVALLKRGLDVLWFGTLAVAALITVGSAVAVTFDVGDFSAGAEVRFVLDPASYRISGSALGVEAASLGPSTAMLNFESPTWVLFLGFAVGLVFLAVVLVVLAQLRRVVATLAAGTPFVPANAARLRLIGLVLIAGEVVRALLALGTSLWLERSLTATGLRLVPAFPIRWEVIVTGLLVLALAAVFRIGTRLQDEHDLTV